MYYGSRIIHIAMCLMVMGGFAYCLVNIAVYHTDNVSMWVILGSVYLIGILILSRMGLKTLNEILRHRKLMKYGFSTCGVIVGVERNYYTLTKYTYVYNVKVIMEDKMIRPFNCVEIMYRGSIYDSAIGPGEIVNVKYYDDEIYVMPDAMGIVTSEENWVLLDRIKRTHGFR